MPRKRLTAQDAFVGVRAPIEDSDPALQEKAREEAAPSDPVEAVEAPPSPSPAAKLAQGKRPRKAAEGALDLDRELAAALDEAQEALAARTPGDRLTLYLPGDLSVGLTQVWEEIRERTQVKVGKSLIAAAALRVVLGDPALRARAAAMALREKLGAD